MTCVVCEGLNLDLILVADIVTKLNLAKGDFTSANPVNTVDKDANDDVATDVINATVNHTVDDNLLMNNQSDNVDDDNAAEVLYADDVNDGVNDGDIGNVATRTTNTEQLIKEQHEDKSLANCWSLAQRDKAGYFVRDGILYRKEKLLGQEFEQLCLPTSRRAEAIRLTHKLAEVT